MYVIYQYRFYYNFDRCRIVKQDSRFAKSLVIFWFSTRKGNSWGREIWCDCYTIYQDTCVKICFHTDTKYRYDIVCDIKFNDNAMITFNIVTVKSTI